MAQTRQPRQDRMTSAERLEAILADQRIDHVPMYHFILGFCAKNVGYSIADMYKDPEKSFMAQLWTLGQYGFDGGPDYGYASYGGGEFGGDIKFPEGEYQQAPSHGNFPVQSEEDVWRLVLPDVKKAGCIPLAMEFSKLQDKFGTPISLVFGGSFTIAGNICPVETLCRWMLKKPETVHRILRLATDHILSAVQYWVDTFGAGRVIPNIWEPLSTNDIISPKQFERFTFPYLKESCEKILDMGVKHILCHVCGEQNLNLPYWSQVPMGNSGMVSVGHQMDLSTAIKYFGDRNIIIGNIEPQVIQTGTPQEIYELCKQAIEKAKYAPRGYMLMSGCEVPPMSPPYNIFVMRQAINDLGWYD